MRSTAIAISASSHAHGGWWGGRGSFVNRSNGRNNSNSYLGVISAALVFFLVSFLLLGSIGCFYARLMLTPNVHTNLPVKGCREDNEGSWAIGVFYGDSPFSLKPIEDMNIHSDKSAAWPVANPVLTCASASQAGFPSNFVADPFLYVKEDALYLFFETKNPITMQGDIGVAKSVDKGVTWEQLGIALDEDWHLSYPYVFEYNGNIYMLPEGSDKGELNLYRAVDFPTKWVQEKVVMKKPIIDPSIISHDGKYWLFGSDHSGIGAQNNGQLEIWYSTSPLGPWRPHTKNPIYNTDPSRGARSGGRPFMYDGNIYRVGQDCGDTYGRTVRIFKIENLTTHEFKEVEVPFGIQESIKGINAWNGARSHHFDVKRLGSGEWIAFLDGDRVHSGDATHRFALGFASVVGVAVMLIFLGVLLGAVKCVVPLTWHSHMGKKSDSFLTREEESKDPFSMKFWFFFYQLIRLGSFLRAKIKPSTCPGVLVLALTFLTAAALACLGVTHIYGGSGAQEPYPMNDHYSQFTLLTMTYDARMWNLKMYIKHYSRCASVREIVVVWNKGKPPLVGDFDSAVPVRIRVEEKNSLNNRFKADPLIKTRAILELDDDIMMTCDDVERGFLVWRQHPERIVGYYPRLVNGDPLEYRAERHARKHNGYNMILTGAAFLDAEMAFKRYWSMEALPGREMVDSFFNCEDVLLNYLYANMSSSSPSTVEYVKPAWAVDMSKFSGVAISGNTQAHYHVRSKCLRKFSEIYGSIKNRKSKFGSRKDGWDV